MELIISVSSLDLQEVLSTQHLVGKDQFKRVTEFVMEEKPPFGIVLCRLEDWT